MSTDPEQRGEVVNLLSAAKRDALAFDLLSTQSGAPAEVMFFLAQQSIEKTLKAVMAHRRVAYRRTHDLVELAALLGGDKSLLEVLSEDLMIRLGPYAVEMRYVHVASPKVTLDEVKVATEGVWLWAQRILS